MRTEMVVFDTIERITLTIKPDNGSFAMITSYGRVDARERGVES